MNILAFFGCPHCGLLHFWVLLNLLFLVSPRDTLLPQMRQMVPRTLTACMHAFFNRLLYRVVKQSFQVRRTWRMMIQRIIRASDLTVTPRKRSLRDRHCVDDVNIVCTLASWPCQDPKWTTLGSNSVRDPTSTLLTWTAIFCVPLSSITFVKSLTL